MLDVSGGKSYSAAARKEIKTVECQTIRLTGVFGASAQGSSIFSAFLWRDRYRPALSFRAILRWVQKQLRVQPIPPKRTLNSRKGSAGPLKTASKGSALKNRILEKWFIFIEMFANTAVTVGSVHRGVCTPQVLRSFRRDPGSTQACRFRQV